MRRVEKIDTYTGLPTTVTRYRKNRDRDPEFLGWASLLL